MRILVADDHSLFRDGVASLLSAWGHDIVGEARDGEEAVTLAAQLDPDLVLMDVRMPACNGVEATRRIKSARPETKIVMLTVSEDEDDLFGAIKAGAQGYLLKDLPGEEVSDAIRRVHDGQAIIPPGMAATLLQEFSRLSQEPVQAQGTPPPQLTDREVEVLRLVARGMANREIAEELVISENTVKNHVRNILEKLHLHSRVEAAVYAHRQHLLPTDD